MQVTNKKKLWETPREYLGDLKTTGKGVGIVVMDEGFDLTHPDLKGRVLEVATEPDDVFDRDEVGHGTHVLGIVGGNGKASKGQIEGVAPEANLIAMKLKLDPKGGWEDVSKKFARGVYWAVQNKEEHNIRVINCSFVLPLLEGVGAETGARMIMDPLGAALKMASDAGISVVAGVGNFADQSPISTPAANPSVIAVGALDTAGTPGQREDDEVAPFSSRGLSYTGESKPDVLAPGVRIMSLNAPGSQLQRRNEAAIQQARQALQATLPEVLLLANEQIQAGRLPAEALNLPESALRRRLLGCFDVQAAQGKTKEGEHPLYLAQHGSSMAAPIVSGVIAHMVEANPALTPAEIKSILLETAQPVAGADPTAQGRGAIDAQKAIDEAFRRASA